MSYTTLALHVLLAHLLALLLDFQDVGLLFELLIMPTFDFIINSVVDELLIVIILVNSVRVLLLDHA